MKFSQLGNQQEKPEPSGITLLDFGLWVAICLFVFALHGNSLHGYWRWDDGTHLYDAARYSVFSFFLDPEVMRTVSGNQIAPWNVFIYWINLALFGMEPAGYYLHHLMSLMAAAGALFLLLRQWVNREHAVVPALLLVMGAPVLQMAQQLMVGHYFDGLTFACLSIWAQVRAVRSGRVLWSAGSAVLYLFGCICKEIYVPWVVLLVLVTFPSFRHSWRYATLPIGAASAYTVFRVLLFSGVGGYHIAAHSFLQSLLDVSRTIPSLLGDDSLGIAASCACGIAIFLGVVAQSHRQRMLAVVTLLSGLLVCGFPLLFVATPGIDWSASARYLWMPWVGLVALWCIPWPLRLRHWRYLALFFFVLAASQKSVDQHLKDRPIDALFDGQYKFVMEPPANVLWLPVEVNGPGYINSVTFSARMAQHLIQPAKPQMPLLVVQDIPPQSAQFTNIRVWHEPCQCMVPLDHLSTQQQQDALQAQTRNLAMVLPLEGVLPRIAGNYGGSIDAVQVQGNSLNVIGWTPTLGPGRFLVFTGFSDAATITIERIERPDVVYLLSRPDLNLAGFQVTMEFASEAAAWHASQNFCAVVQGELAGQEHMFLLLPTPGSQRCDKVIVPTSYGRSM